MALGTTGTWPCSPAETPRRVLGCQNSRIGRMYLHMFSLYNHRLAPLLFHSVLDISASPWGTQKSWPRLIVTTPIFSRSQHWKTPVEGKIRAPLLQTVAFVTLARLLGHHLRSPRRPKTSSGTPSRACVWTPFLPTTTLTNSSSNLGVSHGGLLSSKSDPLSALQHCCSSFSRCSQLSVS